MKKNPNLSIHIWDLKRKNIDYNIDWKLITRAKPYNPVTELCQLCTAEKYYIIYKPEFASLNKRDEIKNHCRHKKSLLLDNC